MQVEKQSTGPLAMNLTVTIDKSDYAPEIKKQLKEYKNQASLKGFRKGKAPESIIRKMFGKQILGDVVIKKLQESLYSYLDEEKIKYLGNPIVHEDQEPLDIDDMNADYSLMFEIGLMPEVNIDDLADKVTPERLITEIEESEIDEAMMHLQKRMGNREEVTDQIQDEDMLDIKAFELEGDEIKEDGWSTDLLILTSQIKDEDVKKDLLTKKVGDSFDFDVYKLESDDPTWVDKHLLHKEADDETEVGNRFRGNVTRVERLTPAEVNQELWDQAFGKDQVDSLETAREFIKDDLKAHEDQKAENLLIYSIRHGIMDAVDLELPKEFLKKWLKDQRNSTEPISDEEFAEFEKGMKWTIIRNEIAQKHDINVEPDDVAQSIKAGIRAYFAQYGQFYDEDRIEEMAKNLMQDQNSYQREYDKVLNLKIIEVLKETLTITEKQVSKEELDEAYAKMNETMNA